MTKALADLVESLAGLDVAGWTGLPAGLAAEPAGPPAALELGDDHVPADMVHADGPARLWTRAGQVVLVDVELRPAGDAAALAALGPPDTDSVRYGLVRADELVYGERGLAAIVDAGGVAVRHVLGFVPTGADEYRRTLRPGFATSRRPPGRR